MLGASTFSKLVQNGIVVVVDDDIALYYFAYVRYPAYLYPSMI